MKRSSLWTLFAGSSLALALALAGGCGKASSSPALGGETHWLQQCGGSDSSASATDCGSGLECLCGVCTTACTEDASCTDLDPRATCAAREATIYAGACESGAPERLCMPGAGSAVVSDGGIAIDGLRYDDARGCFNTSELAGVSTQTTRQCELMPTYARDAGGSCWRFPNGCIPDGFEHLTAEQAAGEACTVAGDLCPEPLDCNDSLVPTIHGCLSCDAASREIEERVDATIRAYASCESDADCVPETWGGPCSSRCEALVNRNYVREFNQALSLDIFSSYCSDQRKWGRSCGSSPKTDCVIELPAVCRSGVCVLGTLAETPCARRTLRNCEGDSSCSMARGSLFDAAGQCFGEQILDVTCMDAQLSCRPVLTPALGASGDCYLLSNCLPDGFEPAPEGSACRAAIGTTCSN